MAKNFYELTYVVNPVLDEEQIKETTKKVDDLLAKHEAEVDQKEEWGIQRIAYEIDGKNSGYFVNMHFEVDGKAIEELERVFKIEDDYIRHLVIKYDNKMKRHYQQKKKGELPVIFPLVEEETTEEIIPPEGDPEI